MAQVQAGWYPDLNIGVMRYWDGVRWTSSTAQVENHPRLTYTVIDIETTGLAAGHDRVIDLGIVSLDESFSPLGWWHTYINPQRPIAATHIHGITDAHVSKAPLFRDVAERLVSLTERTTVVGHNVAFDLRFLDHEMRRSGRPPIGRPFVDTMGEARNRLRIPRLTLQSCCSELEIEIVGEHSALGDAQATATLLKRLRAMPAVGPDPDVQPRDHQLARMRRAMASRPTATLLQSLQTTDLVTTFADVPDPHFGYLEVLMEALEDMRLTHAEVVGLDAIAREIGIPDRQHLHGRLLKAIADAAVADGSVSKAEREELVGIAELLGVAQPSVPDLLAQARRDRTARLSAGLQPLPADWRLGEPIRVGDSVVFTGCDDRERADLEERAKAAGLTIAGSVSGKTSLLVADGSFYGTKMAEAQRRGTRIIRPDQFRAMLRHIQPAR